MTTAFPLVSIVIPCRNEEKFINKCLDSIVVQDYPKDKIEVLVVDGRSNDKTREIIKEYSKQQQYINLLDNQRKIVPTAMNIGIKAAHGEWVVRLDAHCEYPKDYLKNCIDTAKRTNADNVGGLVVTLLNGSSFGAKCVQAITTHKFGIGNATFRLESTEKRVDTVPFGCFRSELFTRIGLYDERLIRNQDYEFNQRIIKTGGSIWLNPKIKIDYYNQSSLRGLFRQAFFTAEWLSWMWYLAPYTFKFRHAMPVFFTTGLLGSLILSPFHYCGFYILSIICLSYFFLSAIASCQQAMRYNWIIGFVLPFLFFSYHIFYGAGTLSGAIRLLLKRAPVQKITEPWPGAGVYRVWDYIKKVKKGLIGY